MSNKTKTIETIDRIDKLDRDLTPDVLSIDAQIRESMKPENMTPKQREEYERRREVADENAKMYLIAFGGAALALTIGGAVALVNSIPDESPEIDSVTTVTDHYVPSSLPDNPSELVINVPRVK